MPQFLYPETQVPQSGSNSSCYLTLGVKVYLELGERERHSRWRGVHEQRLGVRNYCSMDEKHWSHVFCFMGTIIIFLYRDEN